MRKFIFIFIILLGSWRTQAQKFYFSNDNDSINNSSGITFIYDSVKNQYFFNTPHSNKDFSLIDNRFYLTDLNGNILKSKSEYSSGDTLSFFRNAFKINSNSFLHVGMKYKNNIFHNFYLRYIDSNLNTVNERHISFSDSSKRANNFLSIITSKNRILYCGSTFIDSSPKIKIFLYELSLNGDSIRYAEFGNIPDTFGFSYHVVERVDTPGYIVVNDVDANFYYFDTNLVLQRKVIEKYFGNGDFGTVGKYASLGNGYYIQSSRNKYLNKHWHYLMKYRDDMTYIKYANPPAELDTSMDNGHMPAYVSPVAYSPKGGIYSLEGTRTDANATYNFNNNYVLVCRYDTALNLIWSRFLGGDGFNYVPWTISTAESGSCMVLCARRNLDTLAGILEESFIFKFDTLGTVTSVINVSNPSKFTAMVFPNPTANTFTFWMNNATTNTVLTIYDLQGKLLRSQLLLSGSNNVHMGNFANGQYYYNIVNNKGEKVYGKLLKQ